MVYNRSSYRHELRKSVQKQDFYRALKKKRFGTKILQSSHSVLQFGLIISQCIVALHLELCDPSSYIRIESGPEVQRVLADHSLLHHFVSRNPREEGNIFTLFERNRNVNVSHFQIKSFHYKSILWSWLKLLHFTVLQIQVYPKKNAPGVSKPPRVAKSDFLLILKIFLTLDDIRPSN